MFASFDIWIDVFASAITLISTWNGKEEKEEEKEGGKEEEQCREVEGGRDGENGKRKREKDYLGGAFDHFEVEIQHSNLSDILTQHLDRKEEKDKKNKKNIR